MTIRSWAVPIFAAVLATGGAAREAPARRLGATHPLMLRATVCVEAPSGCPRADETLRVVVAGDERRMGFTKLTVLNGGATAGEIYSALRPRPVRLFGPEEELRKLVPGTPLLMRAVIRPGSTYLFLESLRVPGAEDEH